MPYSRKTWALGDSLNDSNLNTYVRDNMDALKNPPIVVNNITTATDYSTTSTSWVNVGTDYTITIKPTVPTGFTTELFVTSCFSIRPSVNATYDTVQFDISMDGTSVTGNNGITRAHGNNNMVYPVTLAYWITGVTAGAHIIRLRWRVMGGQTATLFVQNTGNPWSSVQSQFAVREVS